MSTSRTLSSAELAFLDAGYRYARAQRAYAKATKAMEQTPPDAALNALLTRAYAELDAAKTALHAAVSGLSAE